MKLCATIVSAIILTLSSSLVGFRWEFTVPLAEAKAQDEIDYREEMIRFVAAIAARARAANPQFGIFPQNGSALGSNPRYLAVVTGIGQEDIYYGYQGDGQATPPQVTQELEANLDRFRAAGRLVLTVDYPFRNENTPHFDRATREKIDQAYQRSSANGYVPYATVRNLNFLVINPGHEPRPNEPPIINWEQVQEWAYQLQPSSNQDRQGFLDALGRSGFDLIVMDYSFDGSEAMEFTPEEIASLKTRLRGKVLAYLSIGEAEDYRWYWRQEWDANHDGRPDPGAPEWLDAENPNFRGNYKVRYWYPEWQAIIFAYLDRILAQGFDGVYLDLIDAYEYYENQ